MLIESPLLRLRSPGIWSLGSKHSLLMVSVMSSSLSEIQSRRHRLSFTSSNMASVIVNVIFRLCFRVYPNLIITISQVLDSDLIVRDTLIVEIAW